VTFPIWSGDHLGGQKKDTIYMRNPGWFIFRRGYEPLVTRMVMKDSAEWADGGVGALGKMFRFYLRPELLLINPCACVSTSRGWLG
jgi:hypothetical protein